MKLEKGKTYYLDFQLSNKDRKIYIAEVVSMRPKITGYRLKTIQILQDNDIPWRGTWVWNFGGNDIAREINPEKYPEYFI